jgi:hypothetical protein
VSLRIVSLFILTTTMMFAVGFASYRAASTQAVPCDPKPGPRSVHLSVPANQPVTIPLSEVMVTDPATTGVLEANLAKARPGGSLGFVAANEIGDGTASITPSGLTFEPQHGFIGSSGGWLLTMRDGREAGLEQASACGSDVESVLVTFEVRNSLPQAFNDALTVPSVADLMDVGPEAGVLANDLDWNGDPLVVHAAGSTEFPWGSVDLAADGSYRILVTNRDQLAPTSVRYVVWDQQGSPTSVDTGYLEIDFSAT